MAKMAQRPSPATMEIFRLARSNAADWLTHISATSTCCSECWRTPRAPPRGC
jgi:hypothetical protein